ncbi:MAG: glycosyltransferase [Woeseiaceae bacterium]|nr:glycosyltransferase [Woeseiaceae bacterium]
MKIAIVVSNLEFGGAQQQIVAFANAIDTTEHSLHIICLSSFVPLADSLQSTDAPVHVIQKRWKFDISVPFRLYFLLRKLNVDVLHGYLFDAEIASRIAGRLARIPVVVGSERNCDYRLKPVKKRFYDLTRNMQDWCIANSYAGARFNSRLLGYDDDHYKVVHNGVDTERFRPSSQQLSRQELDLPDAVPVVGVFASFKAQKNHELFFRAAELLVHEFPNLKLLLVGDELYGGMHGSGEHALMLQQLVDELGLRDRCGFVGNRRDVENIYPACDLTVLPSRHEGMPNAVLESMACGVPVVVTKVADNELLVPDGEVGFVVDSEDVNGLAAKIRILLADRDLADRFGRRARAWVEEKFAAPVMADRLIAAYGSMLRNSRERRN